MTETGAVLHKWLRLGLLLILGMTVIAGGGCSPDWERAVRFELHGSLESAGARIDAVMYSDDESYDDDAQVNLSVEDAFDTVERDVYKVIAALLRQDRTDCVVSFSSRHDEMVRHTSYFWNANQRRLDRYQVEIEATSCDQGGYLTGYVGSVSPSTIFQVASGAAECPRMVGVAPPKF